MSSKRILILCMNILIPIVSVFATAFFAVAAFKYFMPFIIAWLIAMAANPVVRFLEGRIKIHRKHGSIIIIVSVLAVIIGLIYITFSWLFMLAGRFINILPELYETVSADIASTFRELLSRFMIDGSDRTYMFSEIGRNINDSASGIIKNIALPTAGAAGSFVKKLPNVLVYIVITILASYFFTADMDTIKSKVVSCMPAGILKYREYIRRDVKKLIKGYFVAQLKIMCVVGLILLAGFYLLKVKYIFVAAFFIALLDFLPIFGTGTVLIPWAVLKLISADYMYAFGLAAMYIITQAVRQLIQPKLVGDSIGMPALYTLVCLYIGYRWSGIGGMIVSIPIGMFVLKAYEYGVFDGIKMNMELLAKELNNLRKEI